MSGDEPMADSFPADETKPPRSASIANPAATLPRTEAEIAETRRRYNTTPEPATFLDDDPMSPVYARQDIDETPGSVLHFWFGYAAERPALIAERGGLLSSAGKLSAMGSSPDMHVFPQTLVSAFRLATSM